MVSQKTGVKTAPCSSGKMEMKPTEDSSVREALKDPGKESLGKKSFRNPLTRHFVEDR